MENLTDNIQYFGKGTFVKRIKEFSDNKCGINSINESAESINVDFPEIILASAKYNFVSVTKIVEALAGRKKLNLYNFYVDLGTYGVEADLNSVYKMFMNLTGPKPVLQMVPTLSKTYNNFLVIEILKNETNFCISRATFPDIIHLENFSVATMRGGFNGTLMACKHKLDKYESSLPYLRNDLPGWKSIDIEFQYSRI